MYSHGANIESWKRQFGLSGKNILDFSASINPLGPPKRTRKLLRDNFHLFLRYPQDYSQSSGAKIAEYAGISKDNLLVTNGSIEAIYLTARLMARETSLIIVPTFSEYERAIKSSGGRSLYFQTRDSNNFKIDFNKLTSSLSGMSALFICNPDNPTGRVLSREDLLFLAKKCGQNGIILVVDEAFIDFLPEPDKVSLVRSCLKCNNVIILGSLTKFFALPGLRIGHITAHKKLINRIAKFRFPWAVNSFAQVAAVSAIFDYSYIHRTRAFIKKENDFLFGKLSKILAISPYYPSVNFILCRINSKRINSKVLFKKLARQGIFIRDCSNFRGLDNQYFRVAVKLRKDNLKLISALKEIL
ncbi:MAG: threonine-phosphate decarboxylase CobD [Candidatus Omnitrophota bacterium]|nr:threonine-phosphate decarboxylase CobD [Candidatus Omnitrophota bacterium]